MKTLSMDRTAALLQVTEMAEKVKQSEFAAILAEERRIRDQISRLAMPVVDPEGLAGIRQVVHHQQWVSQHRKSLSQALMLVLARKERAAGAYALARARKEAAGSLHDAAITSSRRSREARRLEEIQHMAMLSQAR
jgi:hypothetical protein